MKQLAVPFTRDDLLRRLRAFLGLKEDEFVVLTAQQSGRIATVSHAATLPEALSRAAEVCRLNNLHIIGWYGPADDNGNPL